MTEDEICDLIRKICDALRLPQEGIAGEELMQELELLCGLMLKRHNSIVRTAPWLSDRTTHRL